MLGLGLGLGLGSGSGLGLRLRLRLSLAALALGLLEQGQSAEAAAIFTHAVATLEGAFGASQPELEAFKQEVKKAVAAAAEEVRARVLPLPLTRP